ncbi:MAG: malectin domain-containing carbohydrate-binding protein [Rhodothermales bacterium]|nr:malectin domain-containing carbohydrate-binding protein [Rhodothermales bacterium]
MKAPLFRSAAWYLFIALSAFLSRPVVGQVSEVPVPEVSEGTAPWKKRLIYRPATASKGGAQAVAFDPSGLQGESLVLPTTLQFGPDGRLYVAQKNGLIVAYTVVRNGPQDFTVTNTESITLIKNNTPNHDDDGELNTSTSQLTNNRQITGIYVTGTAQNPIIYTTSSDPREGAGDAGGGVNDSGLDTNSGILHRLTKSGSSWTRLDLVRGLPRSEENHSTNGVVIDHETNILYLGVGGFTNAGSPSNNFARITEYALSASILAIDLDMLAAMPVQGSGNAAYVYDLPTLDDPTRPNVNGIDNPNTPGYDGIDVGDPWGGNNGLNQAKVVADGPVRLHATGFRNPYDLVIMKSPGAEGRMYSIDNGANAGWGGHPVGEGTYPGASAGQCTNAYNPAEPGSTGPGPNDNKVNNLNGLHYIREVDAGKRYYAGHATPVRGNPEGAGLYTFFDGVGVFRTSTTGPNPLPADWPPVPTSEAYEAECDFRNSGEGDGSLVDYVPSTNGMAEYTASTFGGELQGTILSASFGGEIYVARLNSNGDQVSNGIETLFSNFGLTPLDVIAQGDDDPFPGTIWAVTFGAQNITVFEPFEGECVGGPGNQDDDGDGYSNNDEIANGTNECNAGDKPSDFDGDFTSDRLDPDDDNDGIDDVVDAFAHDGLNGIGTTLPLDYDLFNGDIGFFGIGFTGLMTNGDTDYLDQFDDQLIAGGTAGLLTVPDVPSGDALGGQNDQFSGFQFGIDVDDETLPFTIRVRMQSPFFGNTPQGEQSQGFYIGAGDQDNYLKVVVSANDGDGGLEVVNENAGTAVRTMYATGGNGDAPIADNLLETDVELDLFFLINPADGTAHPGYSIDGAEVVYVGNPVALSGANLATLQGTGTALAVGVIATSAATGATYPATWDKITIVYDATGASALVKIEPPNDINESTNSGGSIKITNTSESGQKIESVAFDLQSTLFPDAVFDPDGTAGDQTGKGFTPSQGEAATGLSGHTLSGFHNTVDGDDGFDALSIEFTDFEPEETFTFSIDVDPTSIKGTSAPGPGESGSVSGLELSGALVTVTFDDGSSYQAELFRTPESLSGSQNIIAGGSLATPGISIVGQSGLQAKVADLEHVIRVTGPANTDVRLLVVESALFITGDGYAIDPFEANSAIAIQELTGNTGTLGLVDFEVTITDSQPEGGINYLAAVFTSPTDETSPMSDVVVLDYDPAAVPVTLYRINAGGPAVNLNGVSWSADLYSTGGATFSNNGLAIAGTNDDVLYTSERYDQGATGFGYSIPVPGDGDYNVAIHFAEIFFGAPGGGVGGAGKRVFSIDIEEGQAVLTNLDIYAEVGATTALIKTFEGITVTDGLLDIFLTSSTREGKISAIEVSTFGEPSTVSASPNPINFSVGEVGVATLARTLTISNGGGAAVTVSGITFTGSNAGEFSSSFTNPVVIAAGGTTTVAVTMTAASAGPKTAQLNLVHTGSDDPLKITVSGVGQAVQPGNVLYRVNAGGPSLASLDDLRIWQGDQAVSAANALGQAQVGTPSPYVNTAAAGNFTFGKLNSVVRDASVPSSTPLSLFQTERWDAAASPNMLWSFPVEAGTQVEVRIYLAEIFLTAGNNEVEGPRIFDIRVDGAIPAGFDNINVFAEVGSNVGILRSFVTTSDGAIDIEFVKDGGQELAAVKGIELIDLTNVARAFTPGWNLIGLPLTPPNANYTAIFGDLAPTTVPFTWNGAYVQEASMVTGKGYWLNVAQGGLHTFEGTAVESLTLTLADGWNMVTGPVCGVDVADIDDPAGILIDDTWFAYTGGYVPTTLLQPGMGYWVEASAAGTIGIDCNGGSGKMATGRTAPDGSFGTILLSDGATGSQTLYYGGTLDSPTQLRPYQLPPHAPEGGFDVRFTNDALLIDSEFASITLQASEFPVSLRVVKLAEGDNKLYVQQFKGGQSVATSELGEDETVLVTDEAVTELFITNTVSVDDGEGALPGAFRLAGNYPNPFNPTTTVVFDLPEAAQVRVEVYDVMGRRLLEVPAQAFGPGDGHQIQIDATELASGIYLYRVVADMNATSAFAVGRMSLVK